VFFQPRYTPTVVATSFCADALFNSYEVTKNKKYLNIALSSSNFILNDLNRSFNKNGVIFSYSPQDRSRVYNASLLGARVLARSYKYNKDDKLKGYSIEAAKTIVDKQMDNGAWIYGEDSVQNWVDSFHTGFNLECIFEVMKYTEVWSFREAFDLGMDFYLSNFFLEDGTPKYYSNSTYPIDIHSPAQFIATLSRTDNFNLNKQLVDKVLNWTIDNMQSTNGYFYYQKGKYFTNRIPYMRWSQAWMFYCFSEYFKSSYEYEIMA